MGPHDEIMHELAESLEWHPRRVEPGDVRVLHLPRDCHCVVYVAELAQSQCSAVTHVHLLEHQHHIPHTCHTQTHLFISNTLSSMFKNVVEIGDIIKTTVQNYIGAF